MTTVAIVSDPFPAVGPDNSDSIKSAGSSLYGNLLDMQTTVQEKITALQTLTEKPPIPDYQADVGDAPLVPDLTTMDPALAALRTALGLDTLPTTTELSEVAPFAPVTGTIAVEFTDPTIPATPVAELTYAEQAYVSDVVTSIKAWVADKIANGGTGLAPAVEQQIWDKARDRTGVSLQGATDTILADTAARGFSLPQGATIAALNKAFRDARMADAEAARDIAIKQAELAQQNTQFAIQQAIAIETLSWQMFDQAAARALDLAKAGAALVMDLYKTRLSGAQIQAEIAKIKADVAIAEADVTLRGYQAGQAKRDSDIRLVEAEKTLQTAVLGVFADIYRAKEQEVLARLDAEVRRYLGEYDTNKQKWALDIEQFRANVGLYEASIREDSGNKQTAAQVWGALLSAVAHGLNVNYALHVTQSEQTSRSGQMSLGNSLTESV